MHWEEVTSDEEATRNESMVKEHMASYHDFVKLIGFSALASALTLALLAIFLL
jgi:hypothetical protein